MTADDAALAALVAAGFSREDARTSLDAMRERLADGPQAVAARLRAVLSSEPAHQSRVLVGLFGADGARAAAVLMSTS